MKRIAILSLIFSRLVFAADGSLPQWAEGEKEQAIKSGWIAGAAVLSPYEYQKSADDPEQQEAPSLPEELENLQFAAPSEEELALSDSPRELVPESSIDAYFADRSSEFLVDPQGLIPPAEAREQLEFLNYHASGSSIDLVVYVFGANQEIPSDVRAEETIERFYAEGRPAALVLYHLGELDRTQVYLSPSLLDRVPILEQRRALESSQMKATEAEDPVAQLKAFAVEMSIRLYWMEESLGMTPQPTAVVAEVSENEPAKQTPPPISSIPSNSKVAELAERWGPPVGLTLFCAIGVVGSIAWMRSRSRFRFADLDVEPRLGGTHAAGVGAVISFASANLPPALQREQVPDYLRRA